MGCTSIQEQLYIVRRRSRKIRSSQKAGHLHQLRSAMLRIGFLLAGGSFEGAGKLRLMVLKFRRSMARRREADIAIRRLSRMKVFGDLSKKKRNKTLRTLNGIRDRAHVRLQRLLKSRAYADLLERLKNIKRKDQRSQSNAYALIVKQTNWVLRHRPSANTLHAFRKRIRMIRFLCWQLSLSPLRKRAIKILIDHQDLIGEYLDGLCSIKLLRNYRAKTPKGIKVLIASQERKARKLFPLIITALNSKEFRRACHI